MLDISEGQCVWEIGPGLGAMSQSILDAGTNLTAFEIDPAYCEWLEESLGSRIGSDSGRLRIVKGDVMKTWPGEWKQNPPDRVLGNLPYNAASAIIAAFIENDRMAELSVFTVQDEMGKRMTASPGTKDYSSFSILCQTGARVGDGGRLSPGSFYPAPRVRSRIITLKPDEPCGSIRKPSEFRIIVRSMFSSRRKTLSNNLNSAVRIGGFPDIEAVRQSFLDEKIDLGRRPETVSPCEWVAVANRVARD